jgi:poly-beta-1,6-N-acetyl-D-glucosamine synthase
MGIMNEQKTFRIWKRYFFAASYFITLGIALFSFMVTPGRYDSGAFDSFWLFYLLFLAPLMIRMVVYLIVGPWYRVVMANKDARLERMYPGYFPRVSVIVPAYNEEVGIAQTLSSLAESSYENLEVVIVNDGSKDDTEGRVRGFIDRYGLDHPDSEKKFIYRYKENGGKGRAINTGIGLSSGEIVVTIDADSIVHPDTIGAFVKRFRDPSVMCVGGNIAVGNTNTLVGTTQFFEYIFAFYIKKVDSLFNTIFVVGGAAAAYRRTVFDELGYFDEQNITEDIDMSMRIQDAGMKIEYAADAIVYTEGASDLSSLIKQRLRWKRGRIDTFAKFKRMFFSASGRHNKILTFIGLPLALYAEIELFFDLIILGTIVIYSIITQNLAAMFLSIAITSFIFFILLSAQHGKLRIGPKFKYIAAVWILFYISTFVEYVALIRALKGFLKKQKLEWQRWERKGIFVQDE